ncbi:MAG: DUF971 domain-containing protein [Acidiphilium sp.]
MTDTAIEAHAEEVARIVLDAAREIIRIEWADGASSAIAAPRLRLACRCAWCMRARSEGQAPVADAAVRFEALALHGPAVLHPTFTDGHRTGLFPFTYIRSLVDAGLLEREIL